MISKARKAARPQLTLLPDPPEDERDMQQFPYLANAVLTLRAYFQHALGRRDVLVNGEGYLCPRAGEARRSPRPDCLVALNLPFAPEIIENEGNGYTIEEIGQPPDFVLEVGSETGGRRDHTVKRDIYAELQVPEYWRFDPSGGRHHDVPLAGDLLVEGSYQPIPVKLGPDGVHRGYSAALGLELHWEEGQLRFFNPSAGEYLPNFQESWEQRDEAEGRFRESETFRQQAESERDLALARVRELEEEVRRLQGR